VEGIADVIVSGDEDLLVLHPFAGLPVASPGAFLNMLDAEQPR
jgi:predicted nucleic acid-binding protein